MPTDTAKTLPPPPPATALPDRARSAPPFIGTKDAAAILGVSVSSVQKMVERGTLKAWKTDGGHRRIAIESLQAVARQRGDGMMPATAPEAAALPRPRRGLPIRVVVVEDNPLASRSLQKALDRCGAAVAAEFTTDAAAALMQIAQTPPDLVITDLAMEPFDGFHLIRVLRGSARHQSLPIIVVTGLTPEAVQAQGELPPGVVVYPKPASNERILGFIDALRLSRALGG